MDRLPLLQPGERVLGKVPRFARLERLSLELTRACSKGCDFCYNGSSPKGDTLWTVEEVLSFAQDCIAHGTESVSFGGGEPLQYSGLFDLLRELEGSCFRSLTTNGLLLDKHLDALSSANPNKVHVSLHYPDKETERVIGYVRKLEERGIRTGINLLVRKSQLEATTRANARLLEAGMTLDQILYLPMRGSDSPSARQVAQVAGTGRFQSVTCLAECGASPRFASVGWDKTIAWCSYTNSRRPLDELSFKGAVMALRGLELEYCG